MWLNTCGPAVVSGGNTGEEPKKKCPEIPRLTDYSKNPDASFWAMFPFFAPKPEVQSRIDVNELENLVSECWYDWPARKRKIAHHTLKILKEKALTNLKNPLPGMQCANAKSAHQHWEMLTDAVAHIPPASSQHLNNKMSKREGGYDEKKSLHSPWLRSLPPPPPPTLPTP